MKKFAAILFLLPIFTFAQAPWFDTDWTKRIPLTVNPALVSGTTNDYVALVDLSIMPSGFFTDTQASGADIVVTSDDMVTKLPRELVEFDVSAETGELHVKVPAIASTTQIYVYFDNPTASEADTSDATWQDYRGVWHLDEDNTATSFGSAIVTQQAMDGGDGSWAVLYGSSPLGTSISVAVDEDQIADSERNHTAEELAYWVISGSGSQNIVNSGNTVIGETGIISGVGAASTTVTLNNTYVNPVIVTTHNLVSSASNPVITRVTGVTGSQFDVYLQNPSNSAVTAGDVYYTVMESGLHTLSGGSQIEAGVTTVSGVNRSGNWAASQMNKITPTGVFNNLVVFGQVMSVNDVDWQTFWTSNGSQTNRPNTVNLYVGRHVGADSDTTRASEQVGYIIADPSTATIGGSSSVIGITTDSVAGVTDSAPYTFGLGGGGTGATPGVFDDSTVNDSDGGLAGGISTNEVGQLGRAIELDGVNGTHIPFDDISYGSANSLDELTASFWIKTNQSVRSGILDFDRSEHWQVGLNFHNAGGQNGQISFDTANSANGIRDLNSGVTINDNAWHYVTVVYDDAAVNDKSIYIDGVLAASANQHTDGLGTNANRFGFLGNGSEASSFNGNTNGLPQEGTFDEVRIKHIAASADEVLTTYNNQNTANIFFTTGPIEEQNQSPTKPTELFVNHTNAQSGLNNPSDLPLITPLRFSALFQDLDTGDESNTAQIQVSTDPTFATITHWDSASSTIATTTESNRITDIEFDNFGAAASTALSMDDGVVNYYWRIRFTDAGNLTSPWSDAALFSLLDIPNAPSAIAVSKQASDDFTVMWADNSTNESGFVIERREDSGSGFGPWIEVATTTADSTDYDDFGVPLNSAFQYRVAAFNFAGTSTTVADLSTHYSDPAAPINVFGDYQSDTEFEVNWTDQSVVVLTDRIERCVGQAACDAQTFTQIGGGLITSTSTPFTDNTSIGTDEIYRWRVRADNTMATSQYTLSPFEYTTPAAPGVPVVSYVSDALITITWVDNSEYEDGFRIYVSEDGGVFTEVTPGVNTVGQNSTSYTYTGGQAGSSYQFEVHAHVPETINNTDLSSVATSTVVETTPVAPSNVVGTFVADNSITVSWDDNSNNENLFELFVSENGGPFSSFATTTANTTTLSYIGGSANSSYAFIAKVVVSANPPTNPVELSASSTASDIIYTTPATPSLALSSIQSLGAQWSASDTANFEVGFELDQSDGTTLVKDVPLSNVTSIDETGLSPNTLVSRTLRTYVDNDGTKLFSTPSPVVSVYTLANEPFIATTTVMSATQNSIDWTWQTESNPSNTEYFATNVTSGNSFGWSATSTWTETGLACENSYDFEVKARNQDLVETIVATSTQSTPTCDPTIDLPTNTQVVSSSTVMSGVCSTGSVVTITSLDLVSDPVSFTCVGGSYSQNLQFTASTTGAVTIDLSQTKAPFGTSSVLSVGVIVDPSSGVDSDADGVSDALEDAGHNGGDGNGDGVQDSLQASVAGVPNTVTGGYTTIESLGSCSILQDTEVFAESALLTQDGQYEYPVGLANYKLQCPTNGATSTVSIYYDQDYNTSTWVLRKYASSTGAYDTIADLVTVVPTDQSISSHILANGPASTTAVSKISFVIQDGDVLDDDIGANQEIVDPVGPATSITTTSNSSGGGGTRYYCRDPEATNYTTRKGKEDNGLCRYENEQVADEKSPNDEVQEILDTLQGNTSNSVCSPYLTGTIGYNDPTNDSIEVNKLIDFLNKKEGESLSLDGVYDQDDFEAVKRFQRKYSKSVLEIWGLSEPTGYVYLTTRMKINSLMCAKSLECPLFTQYNSLTQNANSLEVQKTKVFMKELGFFDGVTNAFWDQEIHKSMIKFQETFSATMLKPWRLTKGTGYKYKTTNKFLNEMAGCSTQDLVLENGNTVSY